jgi:hypothetical protein
MLPHQLRGAFIGKSETPGVEGLTEALAAIVAIHVIGAFAGVDIPAPGSEVRAGFAMTPERVEFVVLFHGVNITSKPIESVD